MNDVRTVQVRTVNGIAETLAIEVSDDEPRSLFVTGLNFQKSEFQGADLFDALVAVRIELSKLDLQICCCGARIDVYPSGMSRSMGAGRKAYITKLGHPATQIVDILDDSGKEPVGTVEQQKAFHEKWINSLKR